MGREIRSPGRPRFNRISGRLHNAVPWIPRAHCLASNAEGGLLSGPCRAFVDSRTVPQKCVPVHWFSRIRSGGQRTLGTTSRTYCSGATCKARESRRATRGLKGPSKGGGRVPGDAGTDSCRECSALATPRDSCWSSTEVQRAGVRTHRQRWSPSEAVGVCRPDISDAREGACGRGLPIGTG